MSKLKRFTSDEEMTSEYWRQREERQRQKNIEKLSTLNQQIEDIYSNMEEAINKEIASFYVKYATAEGISLADAKWRVSQLDIKQYERMAKKFVENRDFSDKANDAMRLYNATMKINRLEMLKSNIGLQMVDGYMDIEKLTDKALTDQAREELKRQAGILNSTVHDNVDKLAGNIANASFQNATFSDRIWMHQDAIRNNLGTLLQQGLIQGVGAAELARRLRKEINTSKYNSQRLLRTELARVQIDAQMESYRRNGYSKYKFLALGAHACEECMRNDGEIFDVKDGRIGKNMPPMHPNCMCSTAPVFETINTFKSIKDEFIKNSTPNTGEFSFDKNIIKGRFKEEIKVGELYYKNFGGNIKILNKDLYKGPSPDYAIDNLLWELKTPESHKNFHKLIEKGIKQINAGTLDLQPGGIILDIKKIKEQISIEEIKQIALKRIAFKSPTNMKLIIIDGDEIVEIYQFTKIKEIRRP